MNTKIADAPEVRPYLLGLGRGGRTRAWIGIGDVDLVLGYDRLGVVVAAACHVDEITRQLFQFGLDLLRLLDDAGLLLAQTHGIMADLAGRNEFPDENNNQAERDQAGRDKITISGISGRVLRVVHGKQLPNDQGRAKQSDLR
jgi:hypothetical protein